MIIKPPLGYIDFIDAFKKATTADEVIALFKKDLMASQQESRSA